MRNNIYKEVSDNLGFDEKIVKDVFYSTFEFIRGKISELELKDTNYTEDEFSKLKTSFNLLGLGKLGCPYNIYLNNNKNKGRRNDKDKECQADVEQGHNDNG